MGSVRSPIRSPLARALRSAMADRRTFSPSVVFPPATRSFSLVGPALPAEISFTRASTGYYTDATGLLVEAPVNTPRFDYDPVTLQPLGLLVEPAGTNLILYSEELDNAVNWVKNRAGVAATPVVTPNDGIAPNGTLTADKVVFSLNGGTTNTDQSTIAQVPFVATVGQPYNLTFWARTTDGSTVVIQVNMNGINGTENRITVTPTWTRFAIFYVPGAIDVPNRYPSFRLRGTQGTSDFASIHLWGIDLEASGSIPTSYIKTTAAPASRAADVPVSSGAAFSGWFNPSEGTVAAQWLTNYASRYTGYVWSITDGTAANEIDCIALIPGPVQHNVIAGGAPSATMDVSGRGVLTPMISAMAYKVSDFNSAANGVLGTPDTSGAVPAVNQLHIGSQNGSVQLSGWIKRLYYWNTRLSDAQLQALSLGAV